MNQKQPQDSTRLNKYLALQLGISRREADALIETKKVKLNNKTAELGSRVSDKDIVTINDSVVANKTSYLYLLLNKPVGYVCSRKQQGDNPTIYQLLPKQYHNLKPVGRLDKNTSGLILLTNDGNFAHQMTHPSFYKLKIYRVKLDHDLEPLHQQMINDYGISLEDGPSRLNLQRNSDNNRKEWIITMHEGRNRQIRRTFSALGYEVVKLHRDNFGNYSLGDIKTGEYQFINIH